MKLSDCVRRFFKYYLPKVKGSSDLTIRTYKDTFKLFIPYASRYAGSKNGSVLLADISTEMVLDFLDYLEQERGNSVKTRNQRLSVLKSMSKMIRLLYPEFEDIADRISHIPLKRESKPLFGFLTHDEIMLIFDSVDLKRKEGFRDYAILHLLFDSGMRASEVGSLCLDDLDDKEKTIGILGKGNRFRLVQLETRTVDLVRLYIDKHRHDPKPRYVDRLFINQRGEGFTRHGIYRICRKYIEKVLPAKRLKTVNAAHCFRHSCAVHLLMTDHTTADIKNHLGHEDISSTMVYLKLDLSRRKKVQKRFIDYMKTKIKADPKLDDLIDWDNKEELLEWLDTL